MPRSNLLPAVALLALTSLAAGNTLAAPLVPDVLNGLGTAATFQVDGTGMALEGGLHDWSDLCAHCTLRITVGPGTFLVADTNGGTRALDPGLYEVREYVGLFMHTETARFQHDVQIHGIGKLVRP